MTYYPYYQPQPSFYGSQQQNPQGQFIPQTPQNAPTSLFYGSNTGMGIEYVNGIEGAKAYIMQPNSVKWLMDSDGNYFYLKSSNAQNQASVRIFEYKEVDVATKKAKSECGGEFVTKEEFEALKRAVASLKKAKSGKVGDSVDE